jgi:stress response protein YsnF
VTDTVRREEAHIERSGDVEIKGDKVDDLTTDKDTNA